MIYKENDIDIDILKHLPILEHQSSVEMIPIIENKRLDTNIVKLTDLYNFVESSDYSYDDTIFMIKNVNKINDLTVAIDEAYVYDDPNIVNVFENVVIIPQDTNTPLYRFIEYCLDSYVDTHDMKYLELLKDDNFIFNETSKATKQRQRELGLRAGNMGQSANDLQQQNSYLSQTNSAVQRVMDNNPNSFSNKQKQQLTSDIVAREKRQMENEKKLEDIKNVQVQRANAQANTDELSNKQDTSKMTPEERRAYQAQRKAELEKKYGKPASATNAQSPATSSGQTPVRQAGPTGNPNEPSSLGQKMSGIWSWFQNKLNGANGQGADPNHPGFFTSIMNSIKSFFGGGNPQTATAAQEAARLFAFREASGDKRIGGTRSPISRPVKGVGGVPSPRSAPKAASLRPTPTTQTSPPVKPITNHSMPSNMPTSRGVGGNHSAPSIMKPSGGSPSPSPMGGSSSSPMSSGGNSNTGGSQPTHASYMYTSGNIFNEIYRPRRMYRSRYTR